jgi:hypothetical protein
MLKKISIIMFRKLLYLVFLCLAGLIAGSSPAWGQKPLPADFKKFTTPLLGENVLVFDPSMDNMEIQSVLDTIFKRQTVRGSEFSRNRYALLFKPGRYRLDIRVEYYMQVLGLGRSPEDVIIEGAVRSNTTHGNSVLTNFWRAVENLTIVPSPDSTVVWGVSQAAPMRRVWVRGNLQLFDKGYASGGYLADSRIDGVITSGPQQQWFTRNSSMKSWVGGNWNMFFLGVNGAPAEDWPAKPYTTIGETPVIREKPYLTFEENDFSVRIPAMKHNSAGAGWGNEKSVKLIVNSKEFHVARPGADNAASINSALAKGKNILFAPGIYPLDESLKISRKGTLVMGLGLATLVPVTAKPAIEIADVEGVTVCGFLIDAGEKKSDALLIAGSGVTAKTHGQNPLFLYDMFFRVGGPHIGTAKSCLVINSNNVCVDHVWLWRADHGNGVGWEKNWCANGLVVNGSDVTIYALFNEHFHEYQTLWNGENGRVYFYQSEMPYDPPSVEAWKHGNTYGYASYKVSDNVKNHDAWGIGIYNVFYDAPVVVDQAIETPPWIEDRIRNKIIFWLNGNKESYVKSIINGKGGRIDVNNRKATMK